MSDDHRRTQLAPVVRQVLIQCAESCERALTDYRKLVGGMVTGNELFRDLLRAIATVRTTVDLLDEADSRRELAFSLLRRAALRLRVAAKSASMSRFYAVPPRVTAQPTKPSSCLRR